MFKETTIKNFLFSAVGSSMVLAVFILIAMIAIIASQGKVIDTRTGSLKQTGIIRINSSDTQKLDAIVNGNQVNIKDNRIEFVEVGEAFVELYKNGFTNWIKNVEIFSDIVTEIYPFFLPLEYNSRVNSLFIDDIDIKSVYFFDNLDYFFILGRSDLENKNEQNTTNTINSMSDTIDQKTSSNFALFQYTKSNQSGLLNVFSNNNLRVRKVFEFDFEVSTLLSESKYLINFSPEFKSFVLYIPSKELYYIGRLNFNGQVNVNNSELVSLNQLIGAKIDKIEWIKEDRLLINQNHNLFDYQISRDTLNVVLLSSNNNYKHVVNSGFVYIIKDDEPALYRYDTSNLRRIKVKMPKNFIFPSKITGIYTEYSLKDIFVITTDQGVIYLNLNSDSTFYEVIDRQNIQIVDVSGDGKIILLKDLYTEKILVYKFVEKIESDKSLNEQQLFLVSELNIDNNVSVYVLPTNNHLVKYHQDLKFLSISDIDGGNQQKINVSFDVFQYSFDKSLQNLYISALDPNSAVNGDDDLQLFTINLE